MTILLIEDDPDVREVVTEVLREEGHFVLQAPNGTRGLRFATGIAYDLAIVDMSLPDLDGRDVATKLRSLYRAPIVIMSGHRITSAPQADAILHKPVSLEELRGVLEIERPVERRKIKKHVKEERRK